MFRDHGHKKPMRDKNTTWSHFARDGDAGVQIRNGIKIILGRKGS